MDDIEIIENVPKVQKNEDSKKIFIILGVVGVIALITIVTIMFIILNGNKSEAKPAVEETKTSDDFKQAFKNSYEVTARSYLPFIESALTQKMALPVINVMDDRVEAIPSVYNVTINHQDYTYLCMTLQDLKDGGYLLDNLKDEEGGYIQIWVPDFSGSAITFSNVTNGKYYFQGDANAEVTESPLDSVEVPTKDTKCPTTAKLHS